MSRLLLAFLLALLVAGTAAAQNDQSGDGIGDVGFTVDDPEAADNEGALVFFLLIVSVLVAGTAGFFMGTLTSRPHLEGLRAALTANRPRIQQAALRLKGVSGKIAQSDRVREKSGTALIVSGSLTDAANDLSRLETALRRRGGI